MLLLLTALFLSFACCKRLARLPFVKQLFIPAEPERVSSKRVIQGDCVQHKGTNIGAEHVLADSRLTYIAEDLDIVVVGDSRLAAWIKYE
jgi:hypothetical protein